MKLPDNIIRRLQMKVGTDVSTASGSEKLRHDIESATGLHLSLNTIKRLTGVIPYDNEPRRDTLDILARYLGFGSWKLLLADMEDTVSLLDRVPGALYAADLPAGAMVQVAWAPGRRITLRKLHGGDFSVESAENSKLLAGDVLSFTMIARGLPFLVSEVRRNGKCLGAYSAALEFGVESVAVLTDKR